MSVLRPRTRVISIASILMVFCLAATDVAFTCSCTGLQPYNQALADADEVLVGEVLSVRLDVSDYLGKRFWNAWLTVTGNASGILQSPDRFFVKLQVIERFKGSRSKVIVLLTGDPTLQCETPFAIRDRYLVFASSAKDPKDGSSVFYAARSFCGRTIRLPEGDDGVPQIRALVAASAK